MNGEGGAERQSTTITPASPSTEPFRPRLRRDVQGLRAVAVLVVIADHLWGWPAGGFIGVDVFFVISGYLITGLLLREHSKTGSISFTGFYRRRAKRLLPASLAVLAVTVIGAHLLLSQTRAKTVGVDAVWALLFAGNWRNAQTQTDYFQADSPPSPLQHYWSLGVEEQFYVVWPILIVAVLAAATRLATPTAPPAHRPHRHPGRTRRRLLRLGRHRDRQHPDPRLLLHPLPRLGARHRRAARRRRHRIPPHPPAGPTPALLGRTRRDRRLPVPHRRDLQLPRTLGTAPRPVRRTRPRRRRRPPRRRALGTAQPRRRLPRRHLLLPLPVALPRHRVRRRARRPRRPPALLPHPRRPAPGLDLRLPPPRRPHPPLQLARPPDPAPRSAAGPHPALRAHGRQCRAAARRRGHHLPAAAGVLHRAAGPAPGRCARATRRGARHGPVGPADQRGAAGRPLAAAGPVDRRGHQPALHRARHLAVRHGRPRPGRLQLGAAGRSQDGCHRGRLGGPDLRRAGAHHPHRAAVGLAAADLRDHRLHVHRGRHALVGPEDPEGVPGKKEEGIAAIKALRPDLVIITNVYGDREAVEPRRELDAPDWTASQTAILSRFRDVAGKVVLLAPPTVDRDIRSCYTPRSVPADCVSRVSTDWTSIAGAERGLSTGNVVWADTRPLFCDARGLCPAFVGTVPTRPDLMHVSTPYGKVLAPALNELLVSLGVI